MKVVAFRILAKFISALGQSWAQGGSLPPPRPLRPEPMFPRFRRSEPDSPYRIRT